MSYAAFTVNPQTTTVSEENRYDLFISYARNPDYGLARSLDSFLEAFHTIGSGGLRPLSICRDGGDFSLGALRPGEIEETIRPYLARSNKLLVLCSANAISEKSYVPAEIEWFLDARHTIDDVIVAVTEPGENVFPAPLMRPGLHKRVWYDFRGARAKKGHPYQDFDEARVQLAADLNGESAGNVLPVWKRQQQLATRNRRLSAALVGVILTVLIAVASVALRNAWTARRTTALREAEELANGAEVFAASGPRTDPARALHLAVRAALRAPANDPATALHVARVFHIAATLPPLAVRLQKQENTLRYGVISSDGGFILATDSTHSVGVWNAVTGERKKLPFPPETQLGNPLDEAFLPEYLLQISPDGRMAAAIVDGDATQTIWDLESGRELASVDVVYSQQPFFSQDSVSMISRSWCDEPAASNRCCWKLLWQKRVSQPPEMREPCAIAQSEERFGDDRVTRLIYGRGRPAAISTPDHREYGDVAVPVGNGEKWAAAAVTKKRVIAVAANGWLYHWRDADALTRTLFTNQAIIDEKLAATGDALIAVTAGKRVARFAFDGKELWSAPLGTQDPRPLEEVRLINTSDDHEFLVTYSYGADPYDSSHVGRAELWREDAKKPLRSGEFRFSEVVDLVMHASRSGGWVCLRDPDDAPRLIEEWAFDRPLHGASRSFEYGTFRRFTRDGVWRVEASGGEVRLLNARSQKNGFAPFTIDDNSVAEGALCDFLREASGVRMTADGIVAMLHRGHELKLHRAAAGSWVEVDGQVVHSGRGGVSAYCNDNGMTLLADGGEIREAATGRVLAAHFPRAPTIGFTRGCRELIVRSGGVSAWFVHGGHTRAPEWFRELPVALTGTRMADDLTVAVVTSEERHRAYAMVMRKVRDAARAGDAGAAFLLERFFTP